MPRRAAVAVAAAATVGVLAVGCGSSPRRNLPPGAAATSAPTTVPPTTLAPTTTTSAPPPPPTPEPGWTVVNQTPSAIVTDKRLFAEADGTQITVIRFHAGQVHLALHAGSQDPPRHGVVLPAAAGSQVTPQEQPLLLATFNGGFKAVDAPGGFMVGGLVISPPVTGQASLVMYTDGGFGVGAWNSPQVPQAGRPVVSVRQNLPPLVTGGRPNPTVVNIRAWGDPLHEVPLTARSGAGVDRQGDLLYAASMKALPADLAAGLINAGVTDGMELDINPAWVQLDVAPGPGGLLAAAIPGQVRPSQQYVTGWTRDFVTVLAGD